jgi:hypothetical protein
MSKYVILEYGVAEGTINPYNFIPNTDLSRRSSSHMTGIAQVIRSIVPDAEIVSLQYMNAQRWLDENYKDVWVMSASVGQFMNHQWLRKYKDDIYLVASSSNEGANTIGGLAKTDWWVGIGAVNKDMRLQSYSSWQDDHVDFVGIDGNIYTVDGVTRPLHGTSYSAPEHATQVLSMMLDFHTTYGRKPRIDEILSTTRTFAKDVHTEGKDQQTGYGYYSHKKGELIMTFKDADLIAEWARPSIEKAKLLGILKGDAEGNVNPKEPVSLERLMTILDRSGALGK